MSIRLYIGNLPQTFEEQELVALLKSVGEGIRFKTVLDRETGNSRGFGFANVEDPKLADAVIEALNGKDFGGSALRVERSERRDNNAGGNRRGAANAAGQPQVARKAVNKVVHSDAEERRCSRSPLGRRTLQTQGSAGQPEDGGLTRR